MTKLSKRAQTLLARVRRGAWYPEHDPRTPNAMQELIDAGLVNTRGRVQVVRSCYVPATFISHSPEIIYPAPRGGDSGEV